MNCAIFQELLSDYLEGSVEKSLRPSLASHLIECLQCRALYEDVRTAMALCRDAADIHSPAALPERILAATTAGEMMSCSVFDELISDYFDGYVSASDSQVFLSHFEQCARCSRLLETIRVARELCKEMRSVDAPMDLADRILATTSRLVSAAHGRTGTGALMPARKALTRLRLRADGAFRSLLSPETVAAGILCMATLGFLLADFSDDHTVPGIYRQAEAGIERLARRRIEVTAGKERLALNLRQIQFQMSSALTGGTALFGVGVEKSKDKTSETPAPAPPKTPPPKPPENPPGGPKSGNGVE